jgi:hypothetical protein
LATLAAPKSHENSSIEKDVSCEISDGRRGFRFSING